MLHQKRYSSFFLYRKCYFLVNILWACCFRDGEDRESLKILTNRDMAGISYKITIRRGKEINRENSSSKLTGSWDPQII